MRLMVTGTRYLGQCLCPWRSETPCGVGLRHRLQVDSALRPLVYEQMFRRESIELIHGDAKGADRLVAEYWEVHQLGPVTPYPARWSELGKRAGNVRNSLMVSMMPDLVVGFPWVKRSLGTQDALRRAREHGLRVRVSNVTEICPRVEEELDNTPRRGAN